MINYLLVIFLNATLFTSCGATQQEDLNYVPEQKVVVSDQVRIGSSETQLHEAFGTPDSVVRHFDPIIDEEPMYYHYYGKTYFEVISGEVKSFELLNENFKLLGLRVGDPTEKLAKQFTLSYSEKYSVDDESKNQLVRVGMLSDAGIKSDAYYIVFTVDEEKILSIEYWENP